MSIGAGPAIFIKTQINYFIHYLCLLILRGRGRRGLCFGDKHLEPESILVGNQMALFTPRYDRTFHNDFNSIKK